MPATGTRSWQNKPTPATSLPMTAVDWVRAAWKPSTSTTRRSGFTGHIPRVTIEVSDGSAAAVATMQEAQEEVSRRTQ